MKAFSVPAISSLAEARVGVVGLGRAGRSIARFLLARGACVVGWDDQPRVYDSPAVRALMADGLRIWPRERRLEIDWAVVSPGLSDDQPIVKQLVQARIPLVDELDLAAQYLPGCLVAVTGTNGKSTTTVLISQMLAAAGRSVFCGGNLSPGRPLSWALLVPPREFYVAEVSSFQLARSRWLKPKVAVVLNITSDHLDRHRTLRSYAAAKLRILDRQTSDDFAVLNRDDPIVYAGRNRGQGRKLFFGEKRSSGTRLSRGWLVEENGKRVIQAFQIRLPGKHNVLNALAATAAVRAIGVGIEEIAQVLRTFVGLPHRLEWVRQLHGVDYINNSMCTNPTAGAASLKALSSRPIVLIVGGRNKGLPLTEYVEAICRHARWAILIGESGQILGRELAKRKFRNFEFADRLSRAVQSAQQRAVSGDVVLFSPGFASFDQFRDFRERGNVFRREVRRLI